MVVGDAGMGKSRLLAAAEARCPGCRLRVDLDGERLVWEAASRTDSPGCSRRPSPTSTVSTRAPSFGACCSRTDLAPDDARRFGGAIAAIARDASFTGWEEEAPYTPSDPAEVASALTEVARHYVERLLTLAGPRVVVVDDLHWLDPSSVTLAELLVEATADRPLIVLAGTRPTGVPSWVDRPDVQRIDLQGLAEPETARLATLVARAAVDADGIRSIHERTAGNPLFIGETVRAFLEDGTLEWRDGRVALTESGPPRVPVTLRAVLGARIDALEPSGREALGVASIIGITFGQDLLEELLSDPLPPGTLDQLAESGPDPALGRRGVAVRASAHPRCRLRGPAGEPTARPPRSIGRPSRGPSTEGRRPRAGRDPSGGSGRRAPRPPAPARGGRVGAGAWGRVGGRGVLAAGGRAQRDR